MIHQLCFDWLRRIEFHVAHEQQYHVEVEDVCDDSPTQDFAGLHLGCVVPTLNQTGHSVENAAQRFYGTLVDCCIRRPDWVLTDSRAVQSCVPDWVLTDSRAGVQSCVSAVASKCLDAVLYVSDAVPLGSDVATSGLHGDPPGLHCDPPGLGDKIPVRHAASPGSGVREWTHPGLIA